MPTQSAIDSGTSYSIGFLGMQLGDILITLLSVLVFVGRFAYDTIRFVHWYKNRNNEEKTNGRNKED